MTPQKIVDLVNQKADARFGETIERLLFIVRKQHTHQSWQKECFCDYCRFINHTYTGQKLHLHVLKKKHNILDKMYWDVTDGEIARMRWYGEQIFNQKLKISKLKIQKKSLEEDVLTSSNHVI